MPINSDNEEYFEFTGPQRVDKAVHTLEGIMEGITADGVVNNAELSALTSWLGSHSKYAERHPFNEIIPRLNEVIADNIIDAEEKADILWLCEKLRTGNDFYCHITSDMQRLHGILGGIAADRQINAQELIALKGWMEKHEHLRSCYPYDELDALLLDVLEDGIVDSREHEVLLAYFKEFMTRPGHQAIALSEVETQSVSGVCTVCPEIIFVDKTFCFTGKSSRYKRKELQTLVEQKGGKFSNSVTLGTDYLAIGADGNECWAYACYGRKVEKAIENRKNGSRIMLVHEFDLHDAIEDA